MTRSTHTPSRRALAALLTGALVVGGSSLLLPGSAGAADGTPEEPSGRTAPVVGRALPKPVTDAAATPGDGSLVVTWKAPDSPVGDANLYYTAWVGDRSCYTQALSCTFTGLDNGRQYEVSIKAFHNPWGNSPYVSFLAVPGPENADRASWHGGGAYLGAPAVLDSKTADKAAPTLPVALTIHADEYRTSAWSATLQHYSDGVAVGERATVQGAGAWRGTVEVPLSTVPSSAPQEVRAVIDLGGSQAYLTSRFAVGQDVRQAPSQATVTATRRPGNMMQFSGRVLTQGKPAHGEVELYVTPPGGAQRRIHSPYLTLDATGAFGDLLDTYPVGSKVLVVYPGNWTTAASTASTQIAAPVAPTPPKPAPVKAKPKATVAVKPVSKASKLYVNVNPNKGSGYWTFQVQVKQKNGTWRALKTYKTQGKSETRTINLPKGTYRVVVQPKYGYAGATSSAVTLKR